MTNPPLMATEQALSGAVSLENVVKSILVAACTPYEAVVRSTVEVMVLRLCANLGISWNEACSSLMAPDRAVSPNSRKFLYTGGASPDEFVVREAAKVLMLRAANAKSSADSEFVMSACDALEAVFPEYFGPIAQDSKP